MQEYAPDTATGGITSVGYAAMLGFVRAVNAGGLPEGDVTPDGISTAIRGATDVPVALGLGETFSCDANTFPLPNLQSTVCNPLVFATTYSGLEPGDYEAIDSADALAG